MKVQFVMTLTKHPVWGVIMQPVSVEESNTGALIILETALEVLMEHKDLPLTMRSILNVASRYSDKSLQKSFSKEVSLKDFLTHTTEATKQKYIRPYIEKKIRELLPLMLEAHMPLFLRLNVSKRQLYAEDRIIIPFDACRIVFEFIRVPEDSICYSMCLEVEGKGVALLNKSPIIVCTHPAVLVIDGLLIYSEQVDAKKLLPFFNKEQVLIPSESVQTYMKSFIQACLKQFEIRTEGLDIQEIIPSKDARLSLEYDLIQNPVLVLSIYYQKKWVSLDRPYEKIIHVVEQDDHVGLHWYYPDKEWEQGLVASLIEAGLTQVGLHHFCLPDRSLYRMLDWLRMHPDVYRLFSFRQNMGKQSYYLGEIILDRAVEEGRDWFDLKAIVLFGTLRVPFAYFKKHILERRREALLPDGTYALLPEEWFEEYFELMAFGKQIGDQIRFKRNQFQLLKEGFLNSSSITPLEQIRSQPAPEGLQVELRPYQLYGYNWLIRLYERGFGALLADDMGLGKTVQIIALLLHLSKQSVAHRPTLIVMPASLISNWIHELECFAPSLSRYVFSGTQRVKGHRIQSEFRRYSIILTSYHLLRSELDWIKECSFDCIVMDESHYVKNPGSQIYAGLLQLRARSMIALSGTPIENSLTDLWAQMNLINRGLLGSLNGFKKLYEKENTEMLRVIRPFFLRRIKKEVAQELPPLLEETVLCEMSEDQKRVYGKEKHAARKKIMEILHSNSSSKRSIVMLQLMTRLRLIANHPVLVHSGYSFDSGKFEQVITRLNTLRLEGHKVLVFSSFVKHLTLYAAHFSAMHLPYAWLTGSSSSEEKDQAIHAFQTDASVACFFISLKAGGVGLNLTAADYVFILDPWWNPASEMQALSRAYRMGQDKPVFVYRFISSNSIEEKIMQLQRNKRELASRFEMEATRVLDIL